jgi:hypothetical protein
MPIAILLTFYNDDAKHGTSGCERERTTTPRHPVNTTGLTGYDVERRVHSTCGRCAVV